MEPTAPGWYPDPTGRHERRYWSGIRWSRHVDDEGVRAEDPLDGGSPASTTQREPLPRDLDHRTLVDPVPRNRRPVLIAAAAAAVVVAGLAVTAVLLLGGDDPSDHATDDDPVTVAMVGVLRQRSGETVTDDQASCMARAFVDSAGADRLTELGVLDGQDPRLGPDEMSAALPPAFACLDDPTMLAFMEATWTDEAVADLDPTLAPCVFDGWFEALGRDRLLDVYTTFARPDPPDLTEVLPPAEFDEAMRILGECQGPTP